MAFFAMLVFQLAIYVLGSLLNKPSIQNAKATPFEDAGFPDPDPRKKQSVGWGNNRYSNLHIMDLVDYSFEKIKVKVKTSPFTSTKAVVGYKYFVGMVLGVARGGDYGYTITNIYWEDELLWTGSLAPADAGQLIVISEPDFLGGVENGGGLSGNIRVYGGTKTQTVNAYTAAFHATDETPAYRGTHYIVLENFEIGERPNISPMQVLSERFPNQLGLSAAVLKLGPTDKEINAIAMVADLFLNDDFGLSLINSDLNTSELISVATVLSGESPQLGMAIAWHQNEAIKKLFELVRDHVDGVEVFFNGQWTYLLTRPDYVVGNLTVFDDSINSKLIRLSRPDPAEVVNQVEVSWVDRTLPGRPSPIFIEDSAAFQRQGRHRSIQLDFPACADIDVANAIAARELHARGFALATMEIEVNRTAYLLLPSQPFVYKNDTLGIVQMVVRPGEIALGTPKNRTIRLRGLEDVFGVGDTIITPPNTVPASVVTQPQTTTVSEEEDMPYLFNLVDPDNSGTAGATHKPIAWPFKPQGNALSSVLSARVNGAPDFIIEQELDYGPAGTLQSDLDEGTIDTLTTLVIEDMQEAGQLLASLNDTNIQLEYFGHLMIVADSGENEILAYESLALAGTTVTLTNVHRAMMDTMQNAATAGNRVMFHDGQATTLTSDYGSTDLINLTYGNVASTGQGTTSTARNVQFRNRVGRPFPAANFKINGSRYPDAPVVIPPVTVIATGTIALTWLSRDRELNVSSFQADASQGLETSTEYRLEIYDNHTAGNLLRTVTGTALLFDYTVALQNTDGGPFQFYRFELRTQDDTAGTTFNIVDVIRAIKYTI